MLPQSKNSYYETIAGGAGAGPTWHGKSGVQTHMTNTRITDPEILERRYPVVLKRFCLREGSGGEGRFRGGMVRSVWGDATRGSCSILFFHFIVCWGKLYRSFADLFFIDYLYAVHTSLLLDSGYFLSLYKNMLYICICLSVYILCIYIHNMYKYAYLSNFIHTSQGVIREVEFLRPLDVGILSERRACRPFGLLGGGSGLPGAFVSLVL